jgi:NAD+ synthase (glutamine-hydrolysing)
VVIGLSGWIDSWVVASLLTLAIWKENVIAINMPSKFNWNTTKNLAKQLAENLGIEYKIYPIQDEVDIKINKLEKITWEKPSDFEIENIQARLRWQILADISPRYKAIFTSNWNKDELSTGYATLYWDTSWAISIIWDLHKSEVFELAKFINKKYSKEIIPVEMIEMKPSAELSDWQNIDNAWGDPFDYEFLGKLKKAYIERNLTPEDILKKFKDWILEEKLGLDKNIMEYFESKQDFIEEIEKLWKLKHNNFFKRIQYPPIITLTSSAFWTNYRESQNWVYFWKNYEQLKKEILENN